MKKIVLVVLVALFAFSSLCYGAPNPNNWGNTDTNLLLQKNLPYYMYAVGCPQDAASGGTSYMVSGSTAVPTGVVMVEKYIGTTGQAMTLGNGVAGQLLFISIRTCDTGATAVLTPTTKWGFTSITFNAAFDSATLLYVNDTYGWIIIASNSVTIA